MTNQPTYEDLDDIVFDIESVVGEFVDLETEEGREVLLQVAEVCWQAKKLLPEEDAVLSKLKESVLFYEDQPGSENSYAADLLDALGW